jgi:ATP-dependent protease ClpP protease subunit
MKNLEDIYLAHTKIKKEDLKEMLKHDLWFTAKEALRYGLVDEII